MQPCTKRCGLANRSRLVQQHQKRCLKGIVRGVRISQNAPADSHHHRTVSHDDGIHRAMIPLMDERANQILITSDVLILRTHILFHQGGIKGTFCRSISSAHRQEPDRVTMADKVIVRSPGSTARFFFQQQ